MIQSQDTNSHYVTATMSHVLSTLPHPITGAQAVILQSMQARSEEPSLTEWQTEINKQQRELVVMQAALPSSVNLGLTALHLGRVYLLTQSAPLQSLCSHDAPAYPGLPGTWQAH